MLIGSSLRTRGRNWLSGLAERHQASQREWAEDRARIAEKLGTSPEFIDAVAWTLILALLLLALG